MVPTKSARWRVGLPFAALVVGSAVYLRGSPLPLGEVVGVQLGGGSQDLPLPAGTARDAWWDLAFIAGYGTFLWSAARLADRWPGGSRADVARWGTRLLALGAVVADVIEDALVILATRSTLDEEAVRARLDQVEAAATVKFGCLLLAVLALVSLGAGAAVRSARH